MNDFLSSFGMILALLSVLAFFFGLVRLIFVKEPKFSLQLMLYSVIAFIIGFGTCYATFPYKF
jgi:hypothetical protein